jgi:hypothetical protein
MAVLRLDLAPGVLIVNPEKITPTQMDELTDLLAEVSLKSTIFGKYPLQDNESLEEWRERVEKEIPEKNKKKEDETASEYMKRVFKPQQDKKQMVFDTLEAMAKVFGGSVSHEGFMKQPYGDSKSFVVKVLKAIDFPTGEYE